MTDILEKYRVDDLFIDSAAVRLVFLLESPYTDEVNHGHPLAGSSGRSMARFLVENVGCFADWDPKVPIGCQIRGRKESKIALMNCSNYPLDRSVYCPADYAALAEKIDGWDLIRKNPKATRRNNADYCGLEKNILADLSERLHRVPESALIVPCGDVARTLLEKCLDPRRFVYEYKVPHPSRNLWFSDRNFDDKPHFIETIACRLA